MRPTAPHPLVLALALIPFSAPVQAAPAPANESALAAPRPLAVFDPAGTRRILEPGTPPQPLEGLEEGAAGARTWAAWATDPAAYRRALHQALQLPEEAGGRTPQPPWQLIAGGIFHFDGISHMAGRMTSAAYAFDHAQGRTTLYLGASGGGLWKVLYAGIFAFWVPISTTLPGSPSVGAFAVDPADSARILVATGDSFRATGSGVYRTLDGGLSWTQMELGTTPPAAFQRMRVDRSDPGTVLLSGDAGIWRSEDFGGSWTLVYSGATSDLAQHPTSLATWWAGAPGLGFVRSTNGGLSFLPAAGNADLTLPVSRVSIAISESSPTYMFALIAAGTTLNGVYRSANSGADWTKIYATDDISFGTGHIASAIAVHPTNPSILIVGQGGTKMTSNATVAVPTWSNVQRGHDDVTSITFVPDALSPGNTNLIVTNDGGYYVVDYVAGTYDGSGNRLGLEAQEVIGPYNTLAASRTDPSVLYAGLQDNGLVRIDTDASTKQRFEDCCDGGQVSVSPDNADAVFYSLGAAFNRYYSLSQGFYTSKVPVQCGFSQPWSPSVLHDPTPGVGFEIFTFELSEQARVTGSQNLAVNPLTAAETLSIQLNGVTRTANLAAGDNDVAAATKVVNAMIAAGHPVAAQSDGGRLLIFAADFGAAESLTVTSNRGSGVGTTGFGTSGLSDSGRDSNAWFKPVSSACNWAKVNPTSFPLDPPFIPNLIDQANNLSDYVFYLTSESSATLIALDQDVHGVPGNMGFEERTPPLPNGSTRTDGGAFADRSELQPNTVYYTTGRARPSRAYLSLARGETSPQSWQDVTGDLATKLPDANYWELVGNPSNLNQLFLATDVGVMRSDDHGQHWYRYMNGLPSVLNVMTMELSYDGLATPKLRLGTAGRGFWERTLGASDHLFSDGFASGNASAWSAVIP